MNKRFFMLLALLIAALFVVPVGTAEAADCNSCNVNTGASCSTCGTIQVNVGSPTTCNGGGDCPMAPTGCNHPATVSAHGTVTYTPAGPGGCCPVSGTRTIVVCEVIENCTDGGSIATQCTVFTPACGGTTPITLDPGGISGASVRASTDYRYHIQARDITGTGCASTCDGACATGCTPNCSVVADSCCVEID